MPFKTLFAIEAKALFLWSISYSGSSNLKVGCYNNLPIEISPEERILCLWSLKAWSCVNQ